MSGALPRRLGRSLTRGHLAGLLAVAFAVFGGAAMMTVGAVVVETGVTAHVPADRLAGAPILVSAPQHVEVDEDFDQPLPERATIESGLAERVSGVDGVSGVAVDVSFGATVDGVHTTGHSWDAAALTDPGTAGPAPSPGEAVLDEDLARTLDATVGDSVRVVAPGGAHELRVSAVVDLSGQGVHLAAPTAAGLSGLPDGRGDLLAVDVDRGADADEVADRVEQVVGDDHVVTTGDERGDVESIDVGVARGELVELGGSLGGTLLLLVGCITAGALAVSVAGRRRDLALLRALGMTPRQLRRMVAGQASWAAAAGLVPGVAMGYALAAPLNRWMADHGLVSAALPTPTTPYAGLVVAVLTLLVVQAAARCVTWRSSRAPVRETLQEAAVEPRTPGWWRTGLGALLVVTALGQSVLPLFVTGEAAFLSAVTGTLVGVIGLALAGPALATTVTRRLAGRAGARVSFPTWLALHNTHANALRSAGAVTVLALAASLTVTQFHALSTLARATDQERTDGIVASATVTGGVTDDDLASLAQAPGVDAAVPMTSTTVLRTSTVAGDPTTESFPALGLGPRADTVVDPDVDDGNLADLRGDTVAVDASTAGSWDVEVGDRVDLVLANGAEVRPVVVATYGRGLGLGAVLASTDLLHAHGSGREVDGVLVAGDADAVARWADDRPGVQVSPGPPVQDDAAADAERWLNLVVLLPMLLYVLVAAGNSLAAATGRRRGEITALRVLGATPRQVRSMVTREAGVLAALAIGATFVLSVVPMSVLGLGILGRPWPQGAWWVAPGIAAVVATVAVGTMRGATRRVLSRPPVGQQ